jgi:hypothetical protein
MAGFVVTVAWRLLTILVRIDAEGGAGLLEQAEPEKRAAKRSLRERPLRGWIATLLTPAASFPPPVLRDAVAAVAAGKVGRGKPSTDRNASKTGH